MLNYLGLPVEASAHAAELDHMLVLVHWLMLVLFVGWGAFFVFVLVRFRKKANPRADYAGAKGKFAKSTEVAVAIIEVVLLLRGFSQQLQYLITGLIVLAVIMLHTIGERR